MPESNNTPNDKFRIIIYHGHIHLLSTYDKIEDYNNKNDHKIPKKIHSTKSSE